MLVQILSQNNIEISPLKHNLFQDDFSVENDRGCIKQPLKIIKSQFAHTTGILTICLSNSVFGTTSVEIDNPSF